MNRLMRTRSVGSGSNLERYSWDDKLGKPQRKPGTRLRLGSYGLPMLVVLLIASAFYAAHKLTNSLPNAEGRLPGLGAPTRFGRTTLRDVGQHGEAGVASHVEEAAMGEEESIEICKGSRCQRVGGRAAGQRGGSGSGAAGSIEVDTASLEEEVASIQRLLETTAGGRQGAAALGAATERHQRRQQEQPAAQEEGPQLQQQQEGPGGGSPQRQQQGAGGGSPQGQQQQQVALRGGGLAVPRKRYRQRSKYTPSLKQDIDDLISEAAEVAKLKGIATEADAGSEEEDSAVDAVVQAGADALLKAVEPCTPVSCQPHGICVQGRCQCVVMYTGKQCGHGLLLSRPFLPDVMRLFTAGFEGEFVLHQGTPHKELKVYHPPIPGEDVGSQGAKAYTVVANEAQLQQLLPLLPKRDATLKGAAYASCAVVGSSGSLLLRQGGAEIDAHESVFRFNAAPTTGYEEHVGRRTTHRLTNLHSWGFHEQESEAVMVHTSLPQAVEGLLWNGRQEKPWPVLSLDPDFEDYMTRSFSFAPSQGLYGTMLALHVCRRVTLYGFGLSRSQGVLQRYWDPCDMLSNPQRVEQQWVVVRELAEAGLVQLGEPCLLECMAGAARCAQCRQAAGIVAPAPPECDDAARQQQRQHVVPWRSGEPAQGDASGGGGGQGASDAASADREEGSATAGGQDAGGAAASTGGQGTGGSGSTPGGQGAADEASTGAQAADGSGKAADGQAASNAAAASSQGAGSERNS